MSKTILITGASSGIGKATAKHFQAQGWNVIATMRSPDKETELTRLERVLVTRLDVEDSVSITRAVQAGVERFERIDVLLNNAGRGVYGPLEATPMEKIRRQFEVNVFGLLATTMAVLPHFRANHSGVIINISSMGGKMTFPLGTIYHASKFAVEGLSEALSFEMETIGVKVKIVEPGVIKTDFVERSLEICNDESLTEYQELVGKILAGFDQMTQSDVGPSIVAEAVFQAATDGTDQLRYIAGEDAQQILGHRKAADDATFLAGIKQQFGLGG